MSNIVDVSQLHFLVWHRFGVMEGPNSYSMMSPIQHEKRIGDMEEKTRFLLRNLERWQRDMQKRTKEEICRENQRNEDAYGKLERVNSKIALMEIEIRCLRCRGREQGDLIKELHETIFHLRREVVPKFRRVEHHSKSFVEYPKTYQGTKREEPSVNKMIDHHWHS